MKTSLKQHLIFTLSLVCCSVANAQLRSYQNFFGCRTLLLDSATQEQSAQILFAENLATIIYMYKGNQPDVTDCETHRPLTWYIMS